MYHDHIGVQYAIKENDKFVVYKVRNLEIIEEGICEICFKQNVAENGSFPVVYSNFLHFSLNRIYLLSIWYIVCKKKKTTKQETAAHLSAF